MTTTYYIGSNQITTLNTIGVSIERYYSADYWKIRLYLEDVFTSAVMATLIPNTSVSVSIVDATGTMTYSGTLSYWGTSDDYSYVEVINCTVTFTPST